MAVAMIRTWRGRVRGNLNDAIGTIVGLLAYDAKRPTDPLFSPGERVEVQIILPILRAKLAARRPR